jgi:hypothetical protein
MTNKGMGVKNGHTGSDSWKNDKQNEHRGAHEKGEQGAAAAGGHAAPDTQAGMTGEPGQSQGMDTRTAQPGKPRH